MLLNPFPVLRQPPNPLPHGDHQVVLCIYESVHILFVCLLCFLILRITEVICYLSFSVQSTSLSPSTVLGGCSLCRAWHLCSKTQYHVASPGPPFGPAVHGHASSSHLEVHRGSQVRGKAWKRRNRRYMPWSPQWWPRSSESRQR